MNTAVGGARRAHANEPQVERVTQHLLEPAQGERLPAIVDEAAPLHLCLQGEEGVLAASVEFEGLANKRRPRGIGRLGLATAVVKVADRCLEGIETLVEAPIETLNRLLPQIADVVSGDNGLDVGGEPAAARAKIQTLGGEVDINAGVSQVTNLGPVGEVPGAPVDLVHDYAVGATLLQQFEHRVEDRPARLRGRLLLFEPFNDGDVVPGSEVTDRLALRLKRDSLALLHCGNTDVAETLFHSSGKLPSESIRSSEFGESAHGQEPSRSMRS